jgi:DNA-directed RNA polymerase subunit RPC12/RpoP
VTGHPAPLPSDASHLACWFGGTWDADAEAELRGLLAGCVTGVRIVLAGPEAIVRQAAALARELGAIDEELVLVPEESAGRRVFCSTCRRPFDATGGVGDIVTCPDCGSTLVVDRRFSPAHAAYYGWPSDMRVRR